MSYSKLLVTCGLAALMAAAPGTASAQRRGGRDHGRAVPRGSVRVARPPVVHQAVRPLRSRSFYVYPYRPGVNLGFYYGYPGFYRPYPYWYGYPSYGYYSGFGSPWYGYPYGYPGYGYRYGYPRYGYGGWAGPLGVRPYGGVRIDLPERDAEVYADGYFAGIVDDFDGTFQELRLEAGPHRIEIRAPGFEPIEFDVLVEPGRTITYRTAMRPAQP
jgi:hypothetical protein